MAAHRPFYSSDLDGYQALRPMAVHLEDLLNEYDVDLVQTGHEHTYERTWPVYKTIPLYEGANFTHYVRPKSPIYVVQGTAGALIREAYVKPSPPWSARYENKYGYGRVEVKGNVFKYQFLSVKGSKVIDEWQIVK